MEWNMLKFKENRKGAKIFYSKYIAERNIETYLKMSDVII